jgi:hypothetical protein
MSLVAERLTAVLLAKPLVPLLKNTTGSFAYHLHLI